MSPGRGSFFDSDTQRRFLQSRVATFALIVGGGSLFFWLYRLISMTWSDFQGPSPDDPSMLGHLLAAVILLAAWLSCRSGRRSVRFIRAVETATMAGTTVAYLWMISGMHPALGTGSLVLLIEIFSVMARAIWVPSTARYTGFIGVVTGIPVTVGFYVLTLHNWDTAIFADAAPVHIRIASPESAALQGTISGLVWWILLTGVCMAASNTIHGLRRRVRDFRKLGQYQLESKLGEGGMGMVYRASHAMLRRPTAIKLLPQDRAGEDSIARFEREVQLTAQLSHPNIVTVFDYGRTPDNTFYYAMELLDGASLAEIVELTGAQSPARVVRLVRHVASALAEAHKHGVIHRDIKPGNIMVCEYGGELDVAKVVDFGLVRSVSEQDAETVTAPALIVGTPMYMAPEGSLDPETVDERSDLYALGAVAYYLVTGTHVFEGKNALQVLLHHAKDPPEAPSERLGDDLPEDLEALILDCLAKEPAERPPSARALIERLRAIDVPDAWDAEAWWAEHGQALERRRGDSTMNGPMNGPGQTITVNVATRAQNPSPHAGVPSDS